MLMIMAPVSKNKREKIVSLLLLLIETYTALTFQFCICLIMCCWDQVKSLVLSAQMSDLLGRERESSLLIFQQDTYFSLTFSFE